MKVAVLRETRPGETRVAAVPDTVKELIQAGLEVAVESGAGLGSHISDEAYREAGATVGSAESVLSGARAVLTVQPPSPGDGEVGRLPEGAILVSFLSPFSNLDGVRALAERGVTSFAMELIPRTTRAQKMDALSSQATVAGYKAVLLAADALGKLLPMFMTAAGTIRPGKTLVLGAGVAGLQAIATARRLGSRVEAFDVRPAVKEQVESLGAKFLETEEEVTAEGEGGYAKELSEEQHRKELELIAAHVPEADIVITTAQIPGREAPLLITEEMVESMRPGSVIVDLASESGGNCALTRAGETVERHGVKIMGPRNLPALVPVHASQMYARNVATFVGEMLDEEGRLVLDFEDDILDASCVTHEGGVRHEATRERMEAAGGAPAPAPRKAGPTGEATTGTGAGAGGGEGPGDEGPEAAHEPEDPTTERSHDG